MKTSTSETISRAVFDKEISRPVAACLTSRGLVESIFYIVTTAGVPMRVRGVVSRNGDYASVDSELTTLYTIIKGLTPPLGGPLTNPFYRQRDVPFNHRSFPLYLVTRLAGYDLTNIQAIIDRSLAAKNVGKAVLDLRARGASQGDNWLRDAAMLLPAGRVVLEESTQPLYGVKDVIAYASWGSNDPARKRRKPGFSWLPGAIMTEFVSTDGRTFRRPPATWNIGTWKERHLFFAGAPQTLTADYLMRALPGHRAM